jgi:hypothetical protein
MNTTSSLESVIKKHLYAGKNCLLKYGELTPKAFYYFDESMLVKDPFDFSDREAARRIIRSQVARHKAHMVVITYESWVSNSFMAPPSIAKDRRQAICVYGETVQENKLMLQEFKFTKSGGVVFGSFVNIKSSAVGLLTDFF